MIRYQITDGSAALNEKTWLARLRHDVDFIQIREKSLCARDLARLVRLALNTVHGPRILVNDRADIALACGAAGVHLRANSLPPRRLRRLGKLIVTVSCHDLNEVENAQDSDYLLISPVFSPISKQDSREPLGLPGLKQIATASGIPVIALGGITQANTPDCIEAGAKGVAGITLYRPLPAARLNT